MGGQISALSALRAGLKRGSVAGGNASWLRLGPSQGLPLVVLHGAGLDRAGASWCRALSRLADDHPILAPDLPGHGETSPLPQFRGVEDVATWLVAFLDMLGIERAAITGVSLGGATAIRTALDAPDRVAGIVPVASYGLARRAPLHPVLHAGTRLPLARLTDPLIARSSVASRLALRTLVHDPAAMSADMVAELSAIAAETSAEWSFDRFLWAEIQPEGFRTCLLDELCDLKVPAHFIHGIYDTAVPIAGAREAARIARAPLTELDAGHWPMYEAPDACIAVIEPFVRQLAP